MAHALPAEFIAPATHFVAHPLAVLLRHLLPPLAALIAQPLAVFGRRLLPLLAHFLPHLATLIGWQLGMHGSREPDRGRQSEHQVQNPSPNKHLQPSPLQ